MKLLFLGSVHLELPVVAPLTPLKFLIIISNDEIPPLEVPTIVASTSIETTTNGIYVTPSTPTFEPLLVYKEGGL